MFIAGMALNPCCDGASMLASDSRPVYFLLHIPKTAGETVAGHMQEHTPLGTVWIPGRPSLREALAGARYARDGLPDMTRVRVVAGHHLFKSQQGLFPGRTLRHAVLLRDPVSFCVSFYNYRMMSGLARGASTCSFDLFRRTLPRDFMSHFLLNRWLELRWPALMAMSSQQKHALLNAALSRFWFVGDYTDADALIAAIAPDFGVPPAARRRNTVCCWQGRTKWRPLAAEDLPATVRAEIIASHRMDGALWETWRDVRFDGASVRPGPLPRLRRGGFTTHEFLRPAFVLRQQWLRDGWRGLAPWRAADPAGLLRAHRAREREQWEEAAWRYRKALEAQPEAAKIWILYGNVLKEAGRTEEAHAALREAIRLEPEEADGYLQLGHALKQAGRMKEATEAYRQALARRPEHEPAAKAMRALGA
jgi:hypothetical protein